MAAWWLITSSHLCVNKTHSKHYDYLAPLGKFAFSDTEYIAYLSFKVRKKKITALYYVLILMCKIMNVFFNISGKTQGYFGFIKRVWFVGLLLTWETRNHMCRRNVTQHRWLVAEGTDIGFLSCGLYWCL